MKLIYLCLVVLIFASRTIITGGAPAELKAKSKEQRKTLEKKYQQTEFEDEKLFNEYLQGLSSSQLYQINPAALDLASRKLKKERIH